MDIFMQAAIEEAKKGFAEGGVPVGAVLIKDNKIVGRGYNKRVQKNSPILHAEIDCLNNTGRIGGYRGLILYSTLMPCYMCAGAVVQFGIKRVVVGEAETFSGAPDFMKGHGAEVINLNLDECKQMMREFIKKNPELWNEDIGKL